MNHRLAVAAIISIAVGSGVSALPLRLISVADEITLGKEAQKSVRKEVPVINGDAAAYVTRIGKQLAAGARGPRYPYSFSIANYREINAFALPGGPVWVHRGAIEAAANEAQLAGVLAHEIAHISQRHAADQISQGAVANGLLGLLGAVLGNSGGARTAQMGAQVLAGGYMMKFSRDDEREADRVGVDILRRAGWDARGLLEFMQTLRARAGRDAGSVELFLSTHPAPGERVERLRAQLHGAWRRGTRDSAEFRRTRALLTAMAPARATPR
jgi:predicted Zn-dependent protease